LSLAEHAERTRVVSDDGIRELVVRFGRDGYVVQYRVDENLVLVTRILHGKEAR
jgi:plasmid stabilization system protein ParE